MALLNQTSTNNSNRKPADAYMNIGIRNKSGEVRRLQQFGIQLFLDNPLHKKLIDKHVEDEEYEFTIVGDIRLANVAPTDDELDIEF